MPSDLPHRPTICCSILLSYSVILGLIYRSIPQTPETVYLLVITMVRFIGIILITLYAIVALWIAKHLTGKTVQIYKWNFGQMQVINASIGLAYFFIFLIVESIYFGYMLS